MPQEENDSIRRIASHETIPLRHKILRPNMTPAECVYPGDDDTSSYHFGAFDNDALIGIVSLMPEKSPHSDTSSSYRLRGMAVEPHLQGKGIGKQIVECVLKTLRDDGIKLIWCNARTHAIPFYERCAFKVVGEEFDIPHIGPHFVAQIEL